MGEEYEHLQREAPGSAALGSWSCLVDAETLETANQTVPNINVFFSVEICSGLLEHHAEGNAGENWCQDTTRLSIVVDMEWLLYVALQMNLFLLVFVKVDDRDSRVLYWICYRKFLLTVPNTLSDRQMLHKVLSFAPAHFLGAATRRKPYELYSC